MNPPSLPPRELTQLRHIAAVLLPGDSRSPAASALADFGDLLIQAIEAIGVEVDALRSALTALPDEPTWTQLERLAEVDRDAFDVICATAAARCRIALHVIVRPRMRRRSLRWSGGFPVAPRPSCVRRA